ncbi:hypothetical protein GCM10010885_15140 [Alicyclobacillus cellulosilyticus]|uniref:Uncharacterized protein n=1 Tax=Alicyclobacillus cellulosilyticus TaxID=1003997 RepID=A0A917NK14_9BACL|nr:hypothetical protein [Alicyclobacillus cellulosilyticus]GGJ06959.1 hypothetical protein GCM10010885_15140 [Alicyclobacillus cellulosilyticus]
MFWWTLVLATLLTAAQWRELKDTPWRGKAAFAVMCLGAVLMAWAHRWTLYMPDFRPLRWLEWIFYPPTQWLYKVL